MRGGSCPRLNFIHWTFDFGPPTEVGRGPTVWAFGGTRGAKARYQRLPERDSTATGNALSAGLRPLLCLRGEFHFPLVALGDKERFHLG